ncbi:MAG: lipase chaperone [bacterium]|nr:lipase chaperone [bacterium]
MEQTPPGGAAASRPGGCTCDDSRSACDEPGRRTDCLGALGALAGRCRGPIHRGSRCSGLAPVLPSLASTSRSRPLRCRAPRRHASALPEAAWADAEELAERFLAFRATAQRELNDPALAASGDLERRLQWLRELRRRSFGAELAERLFGEEEARLRVVLAMRRVREDPSLSQEEREAALGALEEEFPTAVRETRARTTAPLRLAQEETALRDAGANDAEIQTLREARVGKAAAARLAALDEERREWDRRLGDYLVERDELLAIGTDPEGLRELRVRHFAEHERLRVERLEASWQAQRPAIPEPEPY